MKPNLIAYVLNMNLSGQSRFPSILMGVETSSPGAGMVLPSQGSGSHLYSLLLHLDSLHLLFFNAYIYKRKIIKLDSLFSGNGQFWAPYLVNPASQCVARCVPVPTCASGD